MRRLLAAGLLALSLGCQSVVYSEEGDVQNNPAPYSVQEDPNNSLTDQSCYNSDDGLNFNKRSTYKGESLEGEVLEGQELCISDNKVQEFYCEDDTLVEEVYECPDFCEAGECVDFYDVALEGAHAILGDANAPVTMIEFGAYNCDPCATFYKDVFKRLKEDYIDTGKLRFVFRHFPFAVDNKLGRMPSEAAECANDQGKFWEMHNKLFNTPFFTYELIVLFAKELDLDLEEFEDCLASSKHLEDLYRSVLVGEKLGVKVNPTSFINKEKHEGVSKYKFYTQKIEEIIAGEE